jgi:hypothetical protein
VAECEDLELPRGLAVVTGPQYLVRYFPFRANYFLKSEGMGVQLLRKTEKIFEVDGAGRLFLGNASSGRRENEYVLRSAT